MNMQHTYNIKGIIRASFIGLVLAPVGIDVDAQVDTLKNVIDRDVDVVNTYLPTIINPHKLQVEPSMDDTTHYKPTFKYGIMGRVEAVNTAPDSLTAAKMKFPKEESLYNALVKMGGGNDDARGEFWYNIPQNEDYHLALNIGHQSCFGKIKMPDDEEVKAPKHHTWVDVDFARFLEKLRFSGKLNFNNSIYSCYGFHTLAADNYLTQSLKPVSIAREKILLDEKQRNTEFDLTLALANPNRDVREKTTFNASVNYGLFTSKAGINQSGINFDGRVRFPIKSNYLFDIGVAVNQFKVTVPNDKNEVYEYAERKHVDVPINPHFGVDFDAIQLRLGARMILEFGGEEDNIYVQPDFKADFNIADGLVRLNLGMTGDYDANSYRSLIHENPYLSPDMTNYVWSSSDVYGILGNKTEIKTTQKPFRFDAGVRVAFTRKVEMHLGIEYGSFDDEIFFVNNAWKSVTASNDTVVGYYNRFSVVRDNGKHFQAKGELLIEPSDKVHILLNAGYNSWKTNYIEEAWYKPGYEIGLNAWVKPTKSLSIELISNVIGNRYALNMTTGETEALDTILDINMGAEYALTDRWNLFLELSNIASQDQVRWMGYSTHRFGAMAGITYKF